MSRGQVTRALAVASLLLAAAAAHAEPAPDARQEAATRFERGVKLYEAHDYAAALAEFEAAHRLVPRYEVLFNIGVTDKKLFRYNDAVRALTHYLDEGGSFVPRDRRAEVERELAEIRALVAEVAVSVEGAPAAIEVDGRLMGTTPLDGPLLLAAGAHTLKATRAGCDAAERTIDVVSGEHVAVALQPRAIVVAPTTATLTLATRPDGAELVVDGRAAGRAPWSGTLDPGGHDVRATLAGHHPTRQEVMLTAGQTRTLTLELVALPPPLRWYKRWYTWTAAAAVVVVAVGAGVGGWFATRPHYDETITF